MTERCGSETPATDGVDNVLENAGDEATPVLPFRMEDQAGYMLRRAYQRMTVLFNECVERELTTQQFATMFRLLELGQASQNELGRQAGMDPATAQGVVRRLSQRRLIERDRDPADKRRTIWRLTPAGRALAEKSAANLGPMNQRLMAGLDPAEQQTLLDLLRRLVSSEPPDSDP